MNIKNLNLFNIMLL